MDKLKIFVNGLFKKKKIDTIFKKNVKNNK